MDWLHELFETEPQLPQAPIVVPATAPAAPPQAPTRRHYYRCIGCLEPYAMAEKLPHRPDYSGTTIAVCGNCDQPLEYMGRVERDRLVDDRTRCACDDRCLSARGPICNCHCGGKNHGAGMLGYIKVTVDRGSVPTVHADNPFRLTKAREAFKRYRDARQPYADELARLRDRKRAGVYLDSADFRRLQQLQRGLATATGSRSHHGRMKTIAALAPIGPYAQHDFDLGA